MADRLVIELRHAVPASNDCLPQAAMSLGSTRGSGIRPRPGLVSRLIVQEQHGCWVLYRMDGEGGFVGDSVHPTRDDALHQARREFAEAWPEQAVDEAG